MAAGAEAGIAAAVGAGAGTGRAVEESKRADGAEEHGGEGEGNELEFGKLEGARHGGGEGGGGGTHGSAVGKSCDGGEEGGRGVDGGVGGEEWGERGEFEARGQQGAEFFEGGRCVCGRLLRWWRVRRRPRRRFVLEEVEEKDVAIGRGESDEGGIEMGGEVGGDCGGDGFGTGHGGLAFVASATGLDAAQIGGTEAGGVMKPADEGAAMGNFVGFFREEDEDGLGDVGGVGVAGEARRGGVDEIGVAADEGFESGAVASEMVLNEFPVGHRVSFLGEVYVHREKRTGFCVGCVAGSGEGSKREGKGGVGVERAHHSREGVGTVLRVMVRVWVGVSFPVEIWKVTGSLLWK